MENFDNFVGSIAASVLRRGLHEDTTVGMIVRRSQSQDTERLLILYRLPRILEMSPLAFLESVFHPELD